MSTATVVTVLDLGERPSSYRKGNARMTTILDDALVSDLAGQVSGSVLGDDQAEEAVRAAYGPNYNRLADVKRRYDRDNVFHLNDKIAIREG